MLPSTASLSLMEYVSKKTSERWGIHQGLATHSLPSRSGLPEVKTKRLRTRDGVRESEMKSIFMATWILGCGRVHGHLKSDILTVTHMRRDKTSRWCTCRSDCSNLLTAFSSSPQWAFAQNLLWDAWWCEWQRQDATDKVILDLHPIKSETGARHGEHTCKPDSWETEAGGLPRVSG